MNKSISLSLSCMLFFFLTVLSILAHQNKEVIPKSPAAEKWNRPTFLDNLTTGTVSYYSFQDERLSHGRISNRVSPFAISLKDIFKPNNSLNLRTVEGRWPGKQAVELDQSAIRLPASGLEGDSFAVSVWIRHTGLGIVKGGNFENAASIIALGDGIFSGWSIDLLQPSNRIVFCISRGKSEPRIGVVSTIRIPPKTWSHITITRSPSTIRIYVNGIPAGKTEHDAVPTKIAATTNLKLGFIGNGFSSAQFQIDESRIFAKPLTEKEILVEALQNSIPPVKVPNEWAEVSDAYLSHEYEQARCVLKHLINSTPQSSPLMPPFRYRLSQLETNLGNTTVACEILKNLAQDANIDLPIRCQALHDFLMLDAGVNRNTDLPPPNVLMNYTPNYLDLSPASAEYLDAMIEYDFYLPLKADLAISAF